MATLKDAVEWIAAEDSPADTSRDYEYQFNLDVVKSSMFTAMVADVWKKPIHEVAVMVLRARRIYMPRGFEIE